MLHHYRLSKIVGNWFSWSKVRLMTTNVTEHNEDGHLDINRFYCPLSIKRRRFTSWTHFEPRPVCPLSVNTQKGLGPAIWRVKSRTARKISSTCSTIWAQISFFISHYPCSLERLDFFACTLTPPCVTSTFGLFFSPHKALHPESHAVLFAACTVQHYSSAFSPAEEEEICFFF